MGLIMLFSPAYRRYSPLFMVAALISVAATFLVLTHLGEVIDSGRISSITKEQWRTKVEALPPLHQVPKTPGSYIFSEPWGYGPASKNGPYEFRKEDLFNAVGPPDHYSTTSVGDKYLYWECSDGEIQFVCSQGAYDNHDVVAGNINDY